MIPFEAALIGWIVISFLLMIDRDNARGFSLAYILALLFLPSGEKIELSGIPDLDKYNVANIGVLLGTIVFHPHLFDRYKFSLTDLLLVGLGATYFFTSYLSGAGMYDGLSQVLSLLIGFVLTVFLARLHLATVAAFKTFLIILILSSVAYAPLSLWEFRMSPQIHQTLYGYFQHQFAQHMRSGWFRPVVCFGHALSLGRFYAFTAFLALLPFRRDLIARFGPIGGYLFLAPLGGLILSQSYGPYMLFALLCAGYFLVMRQVWLAWALPVVAFCWLASVMAGYTPGYGVVDAIQGVNQDRAESLEYRLDALQEYRTVILTRPAFGWGGWGEGRIEGRATDSHALIVLLQNGFVGACFFFGWWFSVLFMAVSLTRRTAGTLFGQRAAAAATIIALSLSITVVDAALDQQVFLLAGAICALYPLRLEAARQQAVAPGPAQQRRSAMPLRQGAG